MSRKVEVQIVGDSSSLHRALGSATSGTSKLGSAFGHVARIAAGLGGILAGVEVLKFGKDSVEAAAQVQKSTESIRANFGASAHSVIAFGENAATAFGISNQASTAFSAQIGITAKNIGLAHGKAAEMDIGLQKLAGSIGMIKGEDPAGVFHTLTLALAGNTRGLKAMGVVVTPLNEKLEAQRLGFIGPKGTISSLNAAQKASVIYGIATKHLGEFQAQAKAHAGDFSNQIIILRARLSNLADTIGAKALPVIQSLVRTISKIAGAPSFTVGVEVAFHGIERGAKSIVEGIQHAFEGSTSVIKIKAPSGKIIGERDVFTKGIIQNISDGLRNADWSKIGTQVGTAIGKAIKISTATASRIVNSLADGLAANSGKIADVMAKIGILMAAAIFQDVLDPSFWIQNWRVAAGVAISAVLLAFGPESKLALALKDLPIAGYFFKALEKFVGAPLLAVLRRVGTGIVDGLRSVFPRTARVAEELGGKIRGGVLGGIRSLPGRALNVIQRMAELVGQALGLTARDAGRLGARIGSRIVDGLDNFVAAVGRVANRIATRIISPLEALASRIGAPIARMAGRLIGAVRGMAGRAGSAAAGVGRAIMEGIASGLDSLVGWLEGKIAGIASGLLDKAKGILHISSPSKRFAEEVGKPIAQGIALGITKHAHLVHGALAGATMPGSYSGGAGSGGMLQVNLVLDRQVLASTIVRMDKDYRRQNGGRPLLSGS